MLITTLLVLSAIPLQMRPQGQESLLLNRPLVLAAMIDTAKILGLPRLKLRDDKGSLYVADKSLRQESLARIYESAGIASHSEINKRKAFIASYVRR